MKTTPFADMLMRDLEKIGMRQGQLAAAMSLDAFPVSDQALSLWKRRGRVPRGRLSRLREVLGPDSEVARASDDELCGVDSDGGPRSTYQRKPVEAPQARTTPRPVTEVVIDPLGLRELLPDAMRSSVGHLVNFGRGVDFVLSYTSEKVLAMVLSADEPTGEALSDLATLATLYSGARAILVIVQATGLTGHPRPRFKAEQLNIAFEVVRTAADAAKLLISVENGDAH